MYNRVGISTPRGSGSNGYIQSNRFFLKPKSSQFNPHLNRSHPHRDTWGFIRKPKIDILDHNRRRKKHVKLLELEDKLSEQGYSESEIAEILAGAIKKLKVSVAAD